MMQTTSKTVDFFLGATTPAGFKGYFEPLRREPGMQMYLIKSGPGCGKSTLMKQLAQKAEQQGQSIERVHCASDPDSLDGVVFLGQRAAIVDATAPHVLEPDAPGADEIVVSLYHTIRAEALAPHREEVKALFRRNAQLRARAARYVASAGSLLLDSRRAEACSTNFEKSPPLCQAALHPGAAPVPGRLLPQRGAASASAITPRGWSFTRAPCRLWPTAASSSGTITGPSPGCCWNSSGPKRWPGGITSSPAPVPCTRRIRSTTFSSLPAAGVPHGQQLAPGAAARRAGRAVHPLPGPGESGPVPGPAAVQRAGRQRAAGTGRCPDGTGQKLPR